MNHFYPFLNSYYPTIPIISTTFTPENFNTICRRLKISQERFELIRTETAIEMRNFGLAPEDWPEEEAADAV